MVKKKKEEKSYVMSIKEAKDEIKKKLEKINQAYDNIKGAEKIINDANKTISNSEDAIEENYKEIREIYKANRDNLPRRLKFSNGVVSLRKGKKRVEILPGFGDKIIEILEENKKELFIRRTFTLFFRASKEKIEKIKKKIEEILKKEKGLRDLKIFTPASINRIKIKKKPKQIEKISGISIVKKDALHVLPRGFKEVPEELKKEF
jgi:hypothetical protein